MDKKTIEKNDRLCGSPSVKNPRMLRIKSMYARKHWTSIFSARRSVLRHRVLARSDFWLMVCRQDWWKSASSDIWWKNPSDRFHRMNRSCVQGISCCKCKCYNLLKNAYQDVRNGWIWVNIFSLYKDILQCSHVGLIWIYWWHLV